MRTSGRSPVIAGFLRNLPIKQKLLVIVMATTAAALLLAGAGIVLLDTVLFRSSLERDLSALAQVVGDNSTAALQFDDPRVAKETLGALRARTHMVTACLYDEGGAVFAQYARPGANAPCPPPSPREEAKFGGEGLTVSHPILLEGSRIGTLVMFYSLDEVGERIKLYGAIVMLILLASSAIAFGLSSRLRDLIAIPISRLAGAAASISESGDYSIRAQKDSADELGILVDAFNSMLQRIQSRDIEVQNARSSLETTLTSIGDAVVATDREGRIVFANPVAAALLGWPTTELTGQPIDGVFRIVNEYSRQPAESPVARVLQDGRISGLANHTLLIARDGTEVPIDDSAAPIRQDGETRGVVLVFRDITARRRAQQDAAYLAAIVESSDDAVIGKSPEGVIQTWNAGAERVYGYKAEEVIGRYMRELLPEDRQAEEADILARLRGGGRMLHFETVRLRKDGTPIDVSLTISPIHDKSGQVVGVSHVARDITEQKRTDEKLRQTQKLESLGVLAGGIAHDFNNLLTGILGNASLAVEDLSPDSPARPLVESVVAASERAAQLSRQMLAYSGKGRFVVEQIDLSARVRDILPLIKASIPPTVELQLNLAESLPPVEADATQLQQVIMNVIINGAEAVPQGQRGVVAIATRLQQVEDGRLSGEANSPMGDLKPGPHVLFEVRDTGIGMDDATQARIFDPFFTTKFTGRGLGLSAVLGIVRGHRGAIEVKSVVGQGTVFQFLFPAAQAAQEIRLDSPRPATDLRGAGLILVVDDEPIVRNLSKHALERYGYKVLLAEDGARGLEIYRNQPDIQCVVLDLTMPVMGGEEAMERMKSVRQDVPIILSSGFNEAQAMQRFEGKGLAGFLQKPYPASALVEKIGSVMPGPANPRSSGSSSARA